MAEEAGPSRTFQEDEPHPPAAQILLNILIPIYSLILIEHLWEVLSAMHQIS